MIKCCNIKQDSRTHKHAATQKQQQLRKKGEKKIKCNSR